MILRSIKKKTWGGKSKPSQEVKILLSVVLGGEMANVKNSVFPRRGERRNWEKGQAVKIRVKENGRK